MYEQSSVFRLVVDEFLPRDAMLSAVYAVVVCLSLSGIVSKRLNVG